MQTFLRFSFLALFFVCFKKILKQKCSLSYHIPFSIFLYKFYKKISKKGKKKSAKHRSRIPGAYSTNWYPARQAPPPPSTHMWNQSIVTVTKKTKMGFSPINPKRACATGQRLDLLKKRIASTTC